MKKQKLVILIALIISFTSFAQRPKKPICYKAWDAKNEIKSGEDFKVYLIYLQHTWNENGSNTNMYYSQIFEVTGTLSSTSYINGQYALQNNEFSVYGRSEFLKAVPSGKTNLMRGREVIIHGDLECLKNMLDYWKIRNTAQYKDNTNEYFEFDYAYELDRVDASFKALKIQEK